MNDSILHTFNQRTKFEPKTLDETSFPFLNWHSENKFYLNLDTLILQLLVRGTDNSKNKLCNFFNWITS